MCINMETPEESIQFSPDCVLLSFADWKKKNMKCQPILLLLCFVVAAASTRLRGEFGRQRFDIDVQSGDDYLNVTMHTPVNAPDTFRATSNLHIFSRSLVAMKNSMDRECYVRSFIESEYELKERVENAAYNNWILGNITEERLILRSTPISEKTSLTSFGPVIASFCKSYHVYAIRDGDAVALDPEGLNPKTSGSEKTVDVAGTCCGCCKCECTDVLAQLDERAYALQ